MCGEIGYSNVRYIVNDGRLEPSDIDGYAMSDVNNRVAMKRQTLL